MKMFFNGKTYRLGSYLNLSDKYIIEIKEYQTQFNDTDIIKKYKKDIIDIIETGFGRIDNLSKNQEEWFVFNDGKTLIYIFNKTYMKYIDISFLSKYNLIILNSNYDFRDGEYWQSKIAFDNIFEFHNCEFKGYINFKNITFNSSVKFEKCIFNAELNMQNCNFKENVYFNNSIFNKHTNFKESKFKKTACFYNVNFNDSINFSACVFKDDLNLVNSKLNLNFDELKKQIKDEKTANDFRDSYRNFKNTLTKQGNTLDALEYHKAELYAKEIELKYAPKNFSLWTDMLTLAFYRHTSNHHTDLLRIVLFTIFFSSFYGIYKLYLNGENICIDLSLIMFSVCAYILNISNYPATIVGIFNFIFMIAYIPNFIFKIYKPLEKENLNFTNIFIFVYVVLISLLLYSLQKTARKNSIIPK